MRSREPNANKVVHGRVACGVTHAALWVPDFLTVELCARRSARRFKSELWSLQFPLAVAEEMGECEGGSGLP